MAFERIRLNAKTATLFANIAYRFAVNKYNKIDNSIYMKLLDQKEVEYLEKEKFVHTSRPPIYEWTLDYENHPQEACETLVMLSIVMPGLPPEPLSYEIVVRFVDIPELINRYEYSYHPRPRGN